MRKICLFFVVCLLSTVVVCGQTTVANYIVLGMIIEKVTGRKFYDEANRRLLKPLKLSDTIPTGRTKIKGCGPGLCRSKQSIRRDGCNDR